LIAQQIRIRIRRILNIKSTIPHLTDEDIGSLRHIPSFFTGQVFFLLTNERHQSTIGNDKLIKTSYMSTNRFISADSPHLVKKHDSSKDAKDDSLKHQQ